MKFGKHPITEYELLKGLNPNEYVYISTLYYQYDISVRDTILEIINSCLHQKEDIYRRRSHILETLNEEIDARNSSLDSLKKKCKEIEKSYQELQEKIKTEEERLQELQKKCKKDVPNLCKELIKKYKEKIQELNEIKKCY
jgi:chromosome segregation ATPase